MDENFTTIEHREFRILVIGSVTDKNYLVTKPCSAAKCSGIAAHCSYRTKETILSIYYEMAAIAGGPSYQTRLDPPPCRSARGALTEGNAMTNDEEWIHVLEPLDSKEPLKRPAPTAQRSQSEPKTPDVVEPRPEFSRFFPAAVVNTYVHQQTLRWRSLVGCQTRLDGRGFGEVKRADDTSTLWVLFDSASGENRPRPTEPEAIATSLFEHGQVTAVIFPPNASLHVLRALNEIRESASRPKPMPQPPARANTKPKVGKAQKQKAKQSKPNTPQAKSPKPAASQPTPMPPVPRKPDYKPPRVPPGDIHLRAIAELRNLSLVDARSYVATVQSLCVTKPFVSTIAAACKQLATGGYSEHELAVRASVIMGLSRKNVMLGSDQSGSTNEFPSVRPSGPFGSASVGRRAGGRKRGRGKKSGMSALGDWESD
jgi:hypothetical protein